MLSHQKQREDMLYRSYIPRLPLREFIDRFWLCSDKPMHPKERILPSGTIEMVFNLREDEIRIYNPLQPDCCKRFSGAVVSGPYSACFMIDPEQHASILGVHFKPGGAYPFIGAPANELADTHVDLKILWGRTANILRERLCTATTADQCFSILEEGLLSRLAVSSHRHAAVSIALEMFQQEHFGARVRDVASQVGLSQRQFIQLFASEVGMTPKLYCRVRRFQRARERLRNIEKPDWRNVAIDCGYFDQSHLIRDFHAFSGLNPSDYMFQRSNLVLPNHVPHAG
jgi:AraC-like DNA-binding protein